MWLEQNRDTVIYILIYVKNNEKAAHILNVSNSIRLNRMPVQTLMCFLSRKYIAFERVIGIFDTDGKDAEGGDTDG